MGDLGGPQDGAVAAEDEGQLAVGGRQGLVVGDLQEVGVEREVGGLLGQGADADVVARQRLDERPGDLAGLLAAGVREQQDAAHGGGSLGLLGHGSTFSPGTPGPEASHTVRWMSSSPSVLGPRRSHRKNSTLPDGPGSGLTVTARAPQPRRSDGLGHGPDRLLAQLRVAHHPALADPALAHLELRLDHQGQVAVGRRDADQRRPAPAPGR